MGVGSNGSQEPEVWWGPFVARSQERVASRSGQLLVSNKRVSTTLFLPVIDFHFKGILPWDFPQELHLQQDL